MGVCDLGGLYFGRGIESQRVKNHYISLIVSLGDTFEITVGSTSGTSQAVLIQKETPFSLKSGSDDLLFVLHIDPYCEIGLQLTNENQYDLLNSTLFEQSIPSLTEFYQQAEKSAGQTEKIIRELSALIIKESPSERSVDPRIAKSLEIIKDYEPDEVTLSDVASRVFLSPSRFSHLFKSTIGISFKQYLAHCKLVKSIKAIHKQNNLIQSSYIGGFSDQPHFTKSFKKSFGIPPSQTKDSS